MFDTLAPFARALAGAALLLSATAAAALEPAGDAARGLAYAKTQCAQCHAVDAGATSSLVFDATPFAELTASPRLTAKDINSWVMSAHSSKRNPAVPPANCADLVAYIQSLALK